MLLLQLQNMINREAVPSVPATKPATKGLRLTGQLQQPYTMLTGQPQSLSFLFRRPQAAAKNQTHLKPPLGRAPTVVQFCCTEGEPSNMPQVLQMAKNDRQLCHSCNIAFVSATENWLLLSSFFFSAAKGTLSLPAYCTGRVLQQPQNVHGSAATKYCSYSDWPVTVSRAVFVVCLFVCLFVFVCCSFCLFVLFVCSRRKTARFCINIAAVFTGLPQWAVLFYHWRELPQA